MYNVTPSRLHQDGDDWKGSTNLSRSEPLTLSKVLNQVHDWIREQEQDGAKRKSGCLD